MTTQPEILIFFSDYFAVPADTLRDYGAFNISLINDLPLFIDPFLLFNSRKPAYKALHEGVVEYVRFLREKAPQLPMGDGPLKAWFTFPEVKQTWLGFSLRGNAGQGLGIEFARALCKNLNFIFNDFGAEQVTSGSHIEKVCLMDDGIGRDNISDFVTNLIKEYLLAFTETFALTHLAPQQRRKILVPRVEFKYTTESWAAKEFELPYIDGDYIILTPRDLLTKDQPWINRHDLVGDFENIIEAVPNDQQRWQLSNYFESRLPNKPTAKDRKRAIEDSLKAYPTIIDHYIRVRENQSDQAVKVSIDKVTASEELYCRKAREIVGQLWEGTEFYGSPGNTHDEARRRIAFLKTVIEDQDGYRIFYDKAGVAFRREQDLQLLFRLTWYATHSDVNREVNNGRGPVDFKVSRGARDQTLVEFKLASNSKLSQNLANQVRIYQKANANARAFKVILFFYEHEETSVRKILKELKLDRDDSVVLIDARRDNKPSASTAA